MPKRTASEVGTEDIRDHISKLRERNVDCGGHDRFHLGAGFYLSTAKPKIDTVSQYQDRILAAAKKAPRFLFRFWNKDSGGPGTFNTAEAVTPRAFAGGRHDHLLFDMQQTEFDKIATDHFAGRDTETVFSSWSQALSIVLQIASSGRREEVRIAILDTKLLGPHNVVMSTRTANEVCRFVDIYDCELPIFGVIDGPAYQAWPLLPLEEDGIWTFITRSGSPRCSSLEDCIRDAWALASGIEPSHFQVPFAAHIMALHPREHPGPCKRKEDEQEILRFLSCLKNNTLHHFIEDATIMTPGYANNYAYVEADRAHT